MISEEVKNRFWFTELGKKSEKMYFCPFGWTLFPRWTDGRRLPPLALRSTLSLMHYSTAPPACRPLTTLLLPAWWFLVGGCEGLFLCLFFSWPYRCVHTLCCPVSYTQYILNKNLFQFHISAICLWNICELPIHFFFFFLNNLSCGFCPTSPIK